MVLEDDEGLDDAVELLIHDLKGPVQLIEGESMRGHERGIDPLHLQDAQQALQAQPPSRTEARLDRLFGHANTPGLTRDMLELAQERARRVKEPGDLRFALKALKTAPSEETARFVLETLAA